MPMKSRLRLGMRSFWGVDLSPVSYEAHAVQLDDVPGKPCFLLDCSSMIYSEPWIRSRAVAIIGDS